MQMKLTGISQWLGMVPAMYGAEFDLHTSDCLPYIVPFAQDSELLQSRDARQSNYIYKLFSSPDNRDDLFLWRCSITPVPDLQLQQESKR